MEENLILDILNEKYPEILKLTKKINLTLKEINLKKNKFKINNIRENENNKIINQEGIKILLLTEKDIIEKFNRIIEDLPLDIQNYLIKELKK